MSSEPCYEVGVEECPARVLHVNENRRLALLRSIKEEFVEFAQQAAKISPAVMMQIQGEDNVGRLCDKIAFELNIHWEEKQQILNQAIALANIAISIGDTSSIENAPIYFEEQTAVENPISGTTTTTPANTSNTIIETTTQEPIQNTTTVAPAGSSNGSTQEEFFIID